MSEMYFKLFQARNIFFSNKLKEFDSLHELDIFFLFRFLLHNKLQRLSEQVFSNLSMLKDL